MDKSFHKNLIEDTFENFFNKEKFLFFIKNFLNELDESKAFHARGYIKEKFKDVSGIIKTYERLGTYTDPNGKKIDILVVYLGKDNSIERARTSLRNFVSDYLKQRAEKDAGLVAFVPPSRKDWRFSFVKMEYELAQDSKGRPKGIEKFTPARRYSFLVGEGESSHTAKSRLLPILEDDIINPTLGHIEEAFNVEKVTKEFFDKYRDLYHKVTEALDELVNVDSAIKNDFQQKNVSTIDFAKKLLGQIVFLYFLQKKGWFGVKRNEEWGFGSKRFLRGLFEKRHGSYKNFFNDILEPLFYEALRLERPGDYYSHFDCRIPFLNGGLFDPINDYDWWKTDILLPDEVFSNNRKTKEGDTGDGILDVFDRYNFTVKEDEPLEKEVAIDPETLGKVFENLLEVKDRKSKGTYYTPREIVHYMCQESLSNYLVTELDGKVKKEDIDTLIKYGETFVEHDIRVINEGQETKAYSFKLPQGTREHAKLIDEKLSSIRVCDPAAGSGAFPVGMMTEVIRARNALTPHIGEDGDRTSYNFKRHAIQYCLYGVDIDPGAVEISKLRLWLSLIVDEEEREKIQPLPNLDYKIVQGNSLLSVEKNLFNRQLFRQLEELKPLYFSETSASKKNRYKNQIDELIKQITNGHKDFDFEVYFSEVFHEKKGFDVVIANPPYGAKFTEKEKIQLKKDFKYSVKGKFESYRIFIERGIEILKESGVLTFVVPNTWLFIEQAKPLRQFILNNLKLEQIIQFPQKTFQATVDSISFILLKELPKPHNEVKIIEVPLSAELSQFDKYLSLVKYYSQSTWISDSNQVIAYRSGQEVRELISRVRLNSNKFSDHVVIRQGLIPYLTKKEGKENKLISKTKMNEKWKEFLDGSRLVGKYYIKSEFSYILYGNSLYAPREPWIFKTPRIIFQLIRNISLKRRIVATYLDEEIYSDRNTGLMFTKKETDLELKYILGILNSTLINIIHSFSHNSTYISFPSVMALPLVCANRREQRLLVDLVDKILIIAKDSDYLENSTKQAKVHEYEVEINKCVYKLYGLTPEDIEVLENSVKK